MNDPNGIFQYKGLTHVFYQFNPVAPVWGAPYWGHVVSKDFVHWKRLPMALAPDMPYDSDGCFSGSATVTEDGPIMLYTGVSRYDELGFHYQLQAGAVPASNNDPEFKEWRKFDEALDLPMPAGGNPTEFRDPTTAWRATTSFTNNQPAWFTTVGAQDFDICGSALYYSTDFKNWTHCGSLFSQFSIADEAKREELLVKRASAKALKAMLPNVDMVSPEGENERASDALVEMWECPDLIELEPGLMMFKYCDQERGRYPIALDWYVLSDQPLDYEGAAAQAGHDALRALYQGSASRPLVLDYGLFYASKVWKMEDGRSMLMGWVYEESEGTDKFNGEGTHFSNLQGWQGMQSLPREMHHDPESGCVRFLPARELASLRTASLSSHTSQQPPIFLPEGEEVELVCEGHQSRITSHSHSGSAMWHSAPSAASSGARQLEVKLAWSLTSGLCTMDWNEVEQAGLLGDEGEKDEASEEPHAFCVGAIVKTGNGTQTSVTISGKAEPRGPDGEMWVLEADVHVDRSLSGGMSNTKRQGGPIKLPPGGQSASDVLQLHLLVDNSVLEVYAAGGRGVITTRIYPLTSEDIAWGVSTMHCHNNAAVSDAAADGVGGESSSCDLEVNLVQGQVWRLGSCWVDEL